MSMTNPMPLSEDCNPVDHEQIGGEQIVGKPLNVEARFHIRLLNVFLASGHFITHI